MATSEASETHSGEHLLAADLTNEVKGSGAQSTVTRLPLWSGRVRAVQAPS
jgi:hypothetical protein